MVDEEEQTTVAMVLLAEIEDVVDQFNELMEQINMNTVMGIMAGLDDDGLLTLVATYTDSADKVELDDWLEMYPDEDPDEHRDEWVDDGGSEKSETEEGWQVI